MCQLSSYQLGLLLCLRVAKIPQGAVLGLVSTSDYSGKGRDMQLAANKLSALALLGSSVALLDLIVLIPNAL